MIMTEYLPQIKKTKLKACTMDKELEDKELQLATSLKNEYCDESGKETDPKKAAEIIHEIGKIYRQRSPNKLSLIKSVGLLNAAIVRNPSNLLHIQNDLSLTCQHILQLAKADYQSANLINKANEVKQSFDELRNELDYLLCTDDKSTKGTNFDAKAASKKYRITSKVASIQNINQKIAFKYKQIMADIGQFCETIMGRPPCEYAIAGMGSLAREEITPYSDFEHIILLIDDQNYKSYLEYFRWYSVIFHTIILNAQETIIPSLNINTLNDKTGMLRDWYFDAHTPRGISFDGMMPHASKFPLGRLQHTKNKPFETELIKPVSEMLAYLSSDADLKNGYHLADILTKTCYVFGNENVFLLFKTGVDMHLKKASKPKRIEQVKQQIKNDLDKYSTRFRLANLITSKSINIKQLVYRSTTIFIAALGRIHNISANTSFEIVNQLSRNGQVTTNTRDELCYAIAIACEIRLKVYSKHKSQNDCPIDLKQKDHTIHQLFDFAGAESTIKYFQIAYCLQCEVAKELNFTKLHFYSDPQIFNFKIGIIFEINSLTEKSLNNRLTYDWNRNEFLFDKCIEQLKLSLEFNHKSNKNDNTNKSKLLNKLANHLHCAGIHDEAVEFYYQTLKIDQHLSLDERKDGIMATTLDNIGSCLRDMQQYEDALTHLKQALEIQRNISLDERKDGSTAATLNNIGSCLRDMQQYEDALTHLKQALEIDRNISLDERKDGSMATTLDNIGSCLMAMQQYEDALTHLKQALEIERNISLDEWKDGNMAISLNNIGSCLRDMQQYEDALTHLKQALEIDRNISLDERKDGNMARTLNNIGWCLRDMQQYEDALTHLKQALEIDRNISLDERKDGNMARTLNNIGWCLRDMQQYEDALTHLKQALEIERNISLDERKDGKMARILNNIGSCLRAMQQYVDALTHLKQALEIDRNLSLDERKDGNMARTLNNIGSCLMDMQQYEDALTHLKQALEIDRNISLDEAERR